MRNPTFHLMAAGLVLALCSCGDDTPDLKKSAPANQPAAPAAKPPAPMTTKPTAKAAKPTPAPAPAQSPATTPAQPTAKSSSTTEPMQTKPATPATPTTPSATTEPLSTPSTPSTPATTEPLAGGQGQTPASGPADAALPRSAIARLSPTSGNQATGTVTFTSTGTGVKVQISLSGLTPGEHGLHIHEKGDCSAPDATSAGEHFSTKPEPHAGPQDAARHTGDLGNVTADAQGRVETSFIDERISLAGEDSILQRAVIVHADKDDLSTQPSGNSGARVACGVIEPQAPSTQPGSQPEKPMDQPTDQPK
jgi:superoxide dismutase, Cu-Zn family